MQQQRLRGNEHLAASGGSSVERRGTRAAVLASYTEGANCRCYASGSEALVKKLSEKVSSTLLAYTVLQVSSTRILLCEKCTTVALSPTHLPAWQCTFSAIHMKVGRRALQVPAAREASSDFLWFSEAVAISRADYTKKP